jgi:hypothetical protein
VSAAPFTNLRLVIALIELLLVAFASSPDCDNSNAVFYCDIGSEGLAELLKVFQNFLSGFGVGDLRIATIRTRLAESKRDWRERHFRGMLIAEDDVSHHRSPQKRVRGETFAVVIAARAEGLRWKRVSA